MCYCSVIGTLSSAKDTLLTCLCSSVPDYMSIKKAKRVISHNAEISLKNSALFRHII